MPAAIHEERGTYREDRHGGGAVPPPGKPTCPKWLSKEARAEWRRLLRDLDDMGLLARCDRAAVLAYCLAWAKFVEKGQRGEYDQNLATHLVKLAGHFGLSPATRARVKAPARPEAEPEGKGRFFHAAG